MNLNSFVFSFVMFFVVIVVVLDYSRTGCRCCMQSIYIYILNSMSLAIHRYVLLCMLTSSQFQSQSQYFAFESIVEFILAHCLAIMSSLSRFLNVFLSFLCTSNILFLESKRKWIAYFIHLKLGLHLSFKPPCTKCRTYATLDLNRCRAQCVFSTNVTSAVVSMAVDVASTRDQLGATSTIEGTIGAQQNPFVSTAAEKLTFFFFFLNKYQYWHLHFVNNAVDCMHCLFIDCWH